MLAQAYAEGEEERKSDSRAHEVENYSPKVLKAKDAGADAQED